MHNNIMAAGSRDRPSMLATGRYPQCGPYKPNTVLVQDVAATSDSPAIPEHATVETPMNMSPKNKAYFKAEKEAIHLILIGIGDEIYSTVDSYQTAQEMWEAIERTHTTTRYKGKELAKPITSPSETASEEDIDPEQAQWDKDMQKNLALIAKYFKKIYKPTNNNLRTSSNSRNKNVDKTSWYKNDNQSGQFKNQRTMNVAGSKENVGSPVCSSLGFSVLTARNLVTLLRNAESQKGLKTLRIARKRCCCANKLRKVFHFKLSNNDWLKDTDEEIDEQELEAHYSYMNDQNDVKSDDERVALTNLKLDGESNNVWDSCLVALQNKQTEFEKYKAFNDRTVNYDKLERKLNETLGQLAQKDIEIKEEIVDNAWIKHSKDQFHAPTAQDMEILIQTCLMPLAIKTQNDNFIFVHELKQEMHADLKYVESLEKEINELEYDKAEFSNMYDMILQECKGKYVETKFDKPSVVRQPNAQQIPKPSALGKPTPFSDSIEKRYFSKTNSVLKTNVSKGLSKPVTAQTLPQTARQAVNTHVLKLGMYQIDNRTTQTRAPQSSQTVRNTNPRVSTSTGVNHKTNVRRPLHKSNQLKDKVVPNNSQVKPKKTQVEEHPRISSISNKTKSLTACNDSLNSRTSNVNAVCTTCGKCLVDSNHFACVMKMLNNVNARTKKPNIVLISSRKPKGHANKSVATPHKKKVASKSTNQKPQSYFRILYEKTKVAFQKSTYFVRDLQGNDLLTGNRRSDLYTISLQESISSTPLYLMAKASPTQSWLGHRILSHLNFDYINLLSKKDAVIGLPRLKFFKDQLCSFCELSKAKSSSFKSKAIPSLKGRLNLLHMDLCGPMRVASIIGKTYILVIIDDYSRYTWTLFLCSKDETPEVLKEFLTMIQRNLQASVITIRTDRGTKFLNKTLNAFLKKEGIEHQTYTARTPEQNGASDYDNSDPIPQLRNVFSSANAHVSLQQELDLLFGFLYDEFFTLTNIQTTSAPSTHTNVHAEENINHQVEEEHLLDDEFTNPFCASVQEVAESSSHNIGNSNVLTFNQPQVFEYRWTKDHPLEQVRGNPSRPVQTRRQLATNPKMCMFTLTMSTAEPKNIKEAMADFAWIEAMQEELYLFDRL
nr:hypothetical protein [Tanacetum cinerariifolium]